MVFFDKFPYPLIIGKEAVLAAEDSIIREPLSQKNMDGNRSQKTADTRK
jgi:hypothetical protein